MKLCVVKINKNNDILLFFFIITYVDVPYLYCICNLEVLTKKTKRKNYTMKKKIIYINISIMSYSVIYTTDNSTHRFQMKSIYWTVIYCYK